MGDLEDPRVVEWKDVVPGLVTRRARTKNGYGLVFAIHWTTETHRLHTRGDVQLIGGVAVFVEKGEPQIGPQSAALFLTCRLP